jgi:hypothetical protein
VPLTLPPTLVVVKPLTLLVEVLPESVLVAPFDAPPELVPVLLLFEFVDVALESAFEPSEFDLVLPQPHPSGRTPRPRPKVRVRSEPARRKSVRGFVSMAARKASFGPCAKCLETSGATTPTRARTGTARHKAALGANQ